MDWNLTGSGKEAGRIIKLHPQEFSCKSEGKLGVGAVVGKSGAAQDQQSKRMVLVRGKGKRVGKAAVTFVLLINGQVSCDRRWWGYQREELQGEVRGNNCPWKEDQEEPQEDRKGDLCLRDFEVRQAGTRARKFGWGSHIQSHGEYIENRKSRGINLRQIFQQPSVLNFLGFIAVCHNLVFTI